MSKSQNQIRLLIPKPAQPEFPLFVYFPGMDGTGLLLERQVPKLAQNFDIRCLSIPGNDGSKWEILVSQTVALIEAEKEANSHRPIYLCGESFGGCLAMQVVLAAPHLFDRLILVNPASSFRQQPWIQWGSLFTQWMPSNFYSISTLGLLLFLASLDKMRESDRQSLLQAMRSVPQRTTIWRLGLLRAFDVTETQLRTIQQPTIVIASGADRLLPSVAEARLLVQRLPQAEMVVLPNSGHACLLESEVDLHQILQQSKFICSDQESGIGNRESGVVFSTE
ncbi:alpha/beta fold hydrolase [Merismopedia glauca]|uniref:Alpha/beta hydrolase n=1 Tax=Merismopedia glauca CCAP 1448/3 TaxID=1296344 RepID=A0A2T1BZZ3_9CYAN|nr:alpha/beta hydrolase [Merismopedia glauca]PSB01443.1 alpha/beta hydrolase [Merismopedia glauca CCAP 1448/3]